LHLSDDFIECPRCGREVYIDLPRCPYCNLDFYPQEGDLEDEELIDNTDYVFDAPPISSEALLIGWLVSSILVIGLHILVSQLSAIDAYSLLGRLILLGIAPISMIISGYISGMILYQRPYLHGSLLGIWGVGISILMEMYWRDIKLEGLLRSDILISWILIMLFSISGTVIAYHQRHRIDRIFVFGGIERDLYENLLKKVGYNTDIVKRLIKFEQDKDPEAGRASLLQSAIDRWERDNR
jgi:hypothetical protein